MQALGARNMLASSPLSSRRAQPFNCTMQSRCQSQLVVSFGPKLQYPSRRGGYRQIFLSRAVGGGADTLDQRKKEAREWIDSWRSNGSAATEAPASSDNSTGTAGEAFADEGDDYEFDDDDDDLDDALAFDDDDEGDDEENEFEFTDSEAPVSEGPFKYNIPNKERSGKFSPDYTLSDGSAIYTSETLDAHKGK